MKFPIPYSSSLISKVNFIPRVKKRMLKFGKTLIVK